MTLTIANFVAGRMLEALEGSFRVRSHFFDYTVDVPNSGRLDVGDAIAAAKKAQPACAALSVAERREILQRAAATFTLSDEEVRHVAMMSGMPITCVRAHAEYSKALFKSSGSVAVVRHGLAWGQLGSSVSVHGFEFNLPPDGIACAFIPPNDPAEPAYVMVHAIMSGAALIVKPSQQEPYMAVKIAKLLTESGYPAGGLNVIHWNTGDDTRETLGQDMVQQTKYHIIMGDIETANTLLAGSERGSSRNCLFCAGKSKAIVDQDADLEFVAESLVASSLDWPHNCVSTKSVVVVGKSQGQRLLVLLAQKFNERVVGDPLSRESQIGFISETAADQMEMLMKGHQEFGYAELVVPFVRVGKMQIRPVLVLLHANDTEVPFLTKELPYTLAVVIVDSFKEAVAFVNDANNKLPERRCMAVSLFAKQAAFTEFVQYNSFKMECLSTLRAYMVFYNKPSTELSPFLRHQGMDLTDFFCRPLSIIDSGVAS